MSFGGSAEGSDYDTGQGTVTLGKTEPTVPARRTLDPVTPGDDPEAKWEFTEVPGYTQPAEQKQTGGRSDPHLAVGRSDAARELYTRRFHPDSPTYAGRTPTAGEAAKFHMWDAPTPGETFLKTLAGILIPGGSLITGFGTAVNIAKDVMDDRDAVWRSVGIRDRNRTLDEHGRDPETGRWDTTFMSGDDDRYDKWADPTPPKKRILRKQPGGQAKAVQARSASATGTGGVTRVGGTTTAAAAGSAAAARSKGPTMAALLETVPTTTKNLLGA